MPLASRARSSFVALGVVAVVAPIAAFAVACLADLPVLPDGADSAVGTGGDAGGAPTSVSAPLPVCGDGVVQRDAGEACDPGDGGSNECTSGEGGCAIVCPEGGLINSTNDHCYFSLSSSAAGVAEGDNAKACASAGGHLVSINSDAERDAINTWLGPVAGFYWVDLAKNATDARDVMYGAVGVSEPGWSSTCSGCYGATHAFEAAGKSFLDICNGYKNAGQCVVGDPGTNKDDWAGANCGGCDAGVSSILHVCEREPVGRSSAPCDDDAGSCMTIKSTASVYELVTSPPLDAMHATLACATKHGASGRPGHLVVFDSVDERESLSRELAFFTTAGLPTLSYWVGLSRTSAGATFVWADSASVSDHPLEWADNEPASGTYVFATIDTDVADNTFDRQLLHAGTGTATLPYVCELE